MGTVLVGSTEKARALLVAHRATFTFLGHRLGAVTSAHWRLAPDSAFLLASVNKVSFLLSKFFLPCLADG